MRRLFAVMAAIALIVVSVKFVNAGGSVPAGSYDEGTYTITEDIGDWSSLAGLMNGYEDPDSGDILPVEEIALQGAVTATDYSKLSDLAGALDPDADTGPSINMNEATEISAPTILPAVKNGDWVELWSSGGLGFGYNLSFETELTPDLPLNGTDAERRVTITHNVTGVDGLTLSDYLTPGLATLTGCSLEGGALLSNPIEPGKEEQIVTVKYVGAINHIDDRYGISYNYIIKPNWINDDPVVDPSEPDKFSAGTTTGGAETGDASDIAVYVIVFLATLCAIMLVKTSRKI